MTEDPAAGHLQRAAALRYAVAVLDERDRQAAGEAPGTAGVKMTVDEALTLAPALAHLLIDAVATLGEHQGLGPDERPAFARHVLEAHLQGAEMDAQFAVVEAEVNGAAG
jgi:hypothetical protein